MTLHLRAAFADLQAPAGTDDALFAEQLQREERSRRRAEDAARTVERTLKERGKESALPYGARMYREKHDQLTQLLKASFEAAVCDPSVARIHGAAMPFFNEFDSVEQIAGVALITAIDQLSRRQSCIAFTQHLGAAIEREQRLMRLRDVSPLAQRKLFRSGFSRRAVSEKYVLQKLNVPCPVWDNQARTMVGAFLLDAVVQGTGLFEVVLRKFGRGRQRMIQPSEHALAFTKSCTPKQSKSGQGPMLIPPRPWSGLFGGGHLTNGGCLIHVPVQEISRVREYAEEVYGQADLSRVYAAVNWLQGVPLQVSGDVADVVRTAWDNGIEGLFPCAKSPPEVPDRLGSDPDEDALRVRNRLAAQVHRDRDRNKTARIRIERSVQAAEELRDRTVWQAMHLDYRGRIYAENRNCTTQGMDHEKALLSFEPEPIGVDGMDWIHKAAAGHYGLSRETWEARLQWGRRNHELMLAVAEDPLSRLELWRGAKDPWQFLQLCRGLREAVETGRTGVPIRMDQTTSGLGILSSLLRDEPTAKLCNVVGNSPKDLYSLVAEKVTKRMVEDLELGETKNKLHAQRWLEIGVSRALIKSPVLAAPYGGTYMGLADAVVDYLDDHYGGVPIEDFMYMVSVPSKYLASIIWKEMKPYVESCKVIKDWLRAVVKTVMREGKPVEWTSPSGLPLRAADRMAKTIQINLLLYGRKQSMNFAHQPVDGQLDPKAASRNVAANFTHALDAALVTLTAGECARSSIPVVMNHDCFATVPGRASELHNLLLTGFSGLYRTDWLAVWHDEIQARSGIWIPLPPERGELREGLIGTNPYLFS